MGYLCYAPLKLSVCVQKLMLKGSACVNQELQRRSIALFLAVCAYWFKITAPCVLLGEVKVFLVLCLKPDRSKAVTCWTLIPAGSKLCVCSHSAAACLFVADQ